MTPFEIKSATLPLVSLILKSADLQQVQAELGRRFGDIPDFFDNDAMVLDLSHVKDAEIDFPRLIELLQPCKVMPVAVRGGSAPQMEAALRAGLAHANESIERTPPASAAAAEPPPPSPAPSAMVVDKPLRSGQQVYARGRDLVVLAQVNPGAEVIADGHIHVYAPLRGKAMAGARGDAQARIITLGFEPQLVSIAGIYRTSEVALPKDLQGKPAQVRLEGGSDGRLVMEGLPA